MNLSHLSHFIFRSILFYITHIQIKHNHSTQLKYLYIYQLIEFFFKSYHIYEYQNQQNVFSKFVNA